jgi:hypothetical protein
VNTRQKMAKSAVYWMEALLHAIPSFSKMFSGGALTIAKQEGSRRAKC